MQDMMIAVCTAAILGALYGLYKRMTIRTTIANDQKRVRRSIDELFDKLHAGLQRDTFRSFRLTEKAVQEIVADNFKANSIHRIVMSIMRYLGIPNERLIVCIRIDEDESFFNSSGPAGLYISGYRSSEISIMLKQSYTLYEIMAIICHECTHHYFRLRRVKCDDTQMNEILTDIAAIYLGFGYYILEGYTPRYQETADGYQTARLGYINAGEIEHVKERINRLRKDTIRKSAV